MISLMIRMIYNDKNDNIINMNQKAVIQSLIIEKNSFTCQTA